MTQQLACQYIKYTNGIIIGDTPLNLMIHSVVDWPERFTVEMCEKIIKNYALLGYEVIEANPKILSNGKINMIFTIAKDYVYFSYS